MANKIIGQYSCVTVLCISHFCELCFCYLYDKFKVNNNEDHRSTGH